MPIINQSLVEVPVVNGLRSEHPPDQGVFENVDMDPPSDAQIDLDPSELDKSIVIGLQSRHCVSFFKTRDQLRSIRNHLMLAYQLEEFLPWEAHEISAGRIESQCGSLVIATNGNDHLPLQSWLQQNEIYVTAIVPIVLLAIGELSQRLPLNQYDAVAWIGRDGTDVIGLHDGVPHAWRWTGSNARAISDTVSLIFDCDANGDDRSPVNDQGLNEPDGRDKVKKVLLANSDDPLRTDLLNLPRKSIAISWDAHEESCDLKQHEAAADYAQRIVRGTSLPTVDLRCGPLQSKDPLRPVSGSLRVLVAAAFFLQLSIITMALVRRTQYRSASDAHMAMQKYAFESVFPDQNIPVGIVARLESETRRLEKLREIDRKIPDAHSVIPVLHKFLSAVPEQSEVPFHLQRIEFSGNYVPNIIGEVESYRHLQAITDRLRVAGFSVPPVPVNKTAQGIALVLNDITIAESSK